MSTKKVYSFSEQLELGKKGEKKVFEYLNNLSDTVDALDLSEHKYFQSYGIDGLLIFDNPKAKFNTLLFDVKTDFQYYRSGKIFMEIYADVATNKKGGILSTKAQVFYYYDPFGGELIKVPTYAAEQWYHRSGISMDHKNVKNRFGQTTTGILISPNDLDRDGVPITIDKIGSLNDYK